jgi:hypothetical protein
MKSRAASVAGRRMIAISSIQICNDQCGEFCIRFDRRGVQIDNHEIQQSLQILLLNCAGPIVMERQRCIRDGSHAFVRR